MYIIYIKYSDPTTPTPQNLYTYFCSVLELGKLSLHPADKHKRTWPQFYAHSHNDRIQTPVLQKGPLEFHVVSSRHLKTAGAVIAQQTAAMAAVATESLAADICPGPGRIWPQRVEQAGFQLYLGQALTKSCFHSEQAQDQCQLSHLLGPSLLFIVLKHCQFESDTIYLQNNHFCSRDKGGLESGCKQLWFV